MIGSKRLTRVTGVLLTVGLLAAMKGAVSAQVPAWPNPVAEHVVPPLSVGLLEEARDGAL